MLIIGRLVVLSDAVAHRCPTIIISQSSCIFPHREDEDNATPTMNTSRGFPCEWALRVPFTSAREAIAIVEHRPGTRQSWLTVRKTAMPNDHLAKPTQQASKTQNRTFFINIRTNKFHSSGQHHSIARSSGGSTIDAKARLRRPALSTRRSRYEVAQTTLQPLKTNPITPHKLH